MINIAICDDDPVILQFIVTKVKDFLHQRIKFKCFSTSSSNKLMDYCVTTEVDILVIDIKMPEINGFNFVDNLIKHNNKIIVIFITNIDMYVYESFKHHPFRFIRKSHIDELDEALTSAIKKIENNKEKYVINAGSQLTYSIKVSDIVYFESQHNNIRVVTIHGKNTFRATLKSVEKDLSCKGFFRIHSGILLSIRYIYKIDTKKLEVKVMYNNTQIYLPVSRNKIKSLVDEYKISLH